MHMRHSTYKWLTYPHRLAAIRPYLPRRAPVLLDVGCGNHSPSITRRYLPDCTYHGLDCDRGNVDGQDERAMDRFFAVDLEDPGGLEAVPDEHYDAVICSHVLEHLRDPYGAAERLASKVRPGGVLYIETPSKRSLRLPSARGGGMGIRGCLNFRDDASHRTVVDLRRVAVFLGRKGWRLRGPRRRWMWRRVLLLPFYAAGTLLVKGFVPASILWDVTGFADALLARRRRRAGTGGRNER